MASAKWKKSALPESWRKRHWKFIAAPWKGLLALGRPLTRSEEHTSELQSQSNIVCRLLLEKKNAIPDKEADAHGLIRVIDESGEDYAIAADRLHTLAVHTVVRRALLAGRS